MHRGARDVRARRIPAATVVAVVLTDAAAVAGASRVGNTRLGVFAAPIAGLLAGLLAGALAATAVGLLEPGADAGEHGDDGPV